MILEMQAVWIAIGVSFFISAYALYKLIRTNGINMAMWEIHLRQDHNIIFNRNQEQKFRWKHGKGNKKP